YSEHPPESLHPHDPRNVADREVLGPLPGPRLRIVHRAGTGLVYEPTENDRVDRMTCSGGEGDDQMRRWGRPRGAMIVWVCALSAALVLALAKGLDEVAMWATILSFFLGLIGVPRALQNSGPDRAQLDQGTEDRLAEAAREQRREEKQSHRLNDSAP